MFHPIEGFEEMRWNKSGSVSTSIVILMVWFLAVVFERQLTGVSINTNRLDRLNILVLLLRTDVVFVLWVVSNWGICTLLEGEGTFKNIWITSAYALMPYIIVIAANTIISNFLIQEEAIFLTWLKYAGIGYSAVLMLSGLRTVHQYSITKTVAAAILTVVGIMLILFVFILIFSLFQQFYVFILTIVSELMYRI